MNALSALMEGRCLTWIVQKMLFTFQQKLGMEMVPICELGIPTCWFSSCRKRIVLPSTRDRTFGIYLFSFFFVLKCTHEIMFRLNATVRPAVSLSCTLSHRPFHLNSIFKQWIYLPFSFFQLWSNLFKPKRLKHQSTRWFIQFVFGLPQIDRVSNRDAF